MRKDTEYFCGELARVQSAIKTERLLILSSIECYDELQITEKLLLKVIKQLEDLRKKPGKPGKPPNVIKLVFKDGK